MKRFILPAIAVALTLSQPASADEYGLSIYGGTMGSSDIETSRKQTYALDNDSHLGLSIDKYVPEGRYGLYYSKTETALSDYPTRKVEMEYLLFQSAAMSPITENLTGYFGAQLGINRLSPNFIESDTFFASGLYAGLEYNLGAGFHIGTEARWIATILKNNSKVTCDLDPETDNTCSWHFDNEIMSQYQASLTLSYQFSL
ncbi:MULTISPECIES: hypothetical protein [unclassified Pseudoalteromonas]|uniref:hypothetical protein n=1 Tax=unclassified Pseudoalteromonas TaxID=194690 RepID=UPI003014A227